MTKKALVFGSAAMAVLLSASTATAQARRDQPNAPRNGVCFYRDANFTGESFCIRAGDDLASIPSGLNDEISSVRVFGRADVEVFKDSGYRGSATRFTADVRNLKDNGWNDRISSARTSREGNARDSRQDEDRWLSSSSMPRQGACFFRNADFTGESFCLARGQSSASLPREFNDKISSVRLRDADVTIYAESDFRGRSRHFRTDTRNIGGTWNDRISSIRVN